MEIIGRDEFSRKALAVWQDYQKSHDVSAQKGQTAGIDPESGRVWFGKSPSDIWDQLKDEGLTIPLVYLGVGMVHYARTRWVAAEEDGGGPERAANGVSVLGGPIEILGLTDFGRKGLAIWEDYQKTHDLSDRVGHAVGVDPVSGRVWIAPTTQDIRRQLEEEGLSTPLMYVRVGSLFLWRKGWAP
jgi:hypothetical protein